MNEYLKVKRNIEVNKHSFNVLLLFSRQDSQLFENFFSDHIRSILFAKIILNQINKNISFSWKLINDKLALKSNTVKIVLDFSARLSLLSTGDDTRVIVFVDSLWLCCRRQETPINVFICFIGNLLYTVYLSQS